MNGEKSKDRPNNDFEEHEKLSCNTNFRFSGIRLNGVLINGEIHLVYSNQLVRCNKLNSQFLYSVK